MSERGQKQRKENPSLWGDQKPPRPAKMESYLCVDKPWRAAKKTILSTIAVEEMADDYDFYIRAMKALCDARGGWLQRLVSWKSYNRVELSQVQCSMS
jgi:hypothetical protein